MTDYLLSLDQQGGANQAAILRRLTYLEQLVNRMVTGAISCTSTTHPATPAVGTQIFETDTGNELIWDGSAWRITQLGAWTTTFVPTWTETGASPAIGNGTINTKYAKIGRTVIGQYQFLFGSTTNFGVASQAWNFSVPFTPDVPASGFWNVGTWSGLAGSLFYVGAVRMETTGLLGLFVNASAFSVNATNPGTWTSSGYLQLDFVYDSVT